jgi:hypothetical protein
MPFFQPTAASLSQPPPDPVRPAAARLWSGDAAGCARLFLLACLLIGYLHYRAEGSVRGDIPADSDSLAYQNRALSDLCAQMQGRLSPHEFFYGSQEINFLPPLHKWSLQLGYVVLGLDNLAPYAVSGLWMVVAAFAVFLIVRWITQDGAFAFAAGLLLLGQPASLSWGFMGSRNDWPAAALCLLGFWCLIASDLGRHRTLMAGCGLFWGLGLLTKASLVGYLALPVLVLAADAIRRRKELSRAQAENVVVAVLAAALVCAWFYAAQYRDVLYYYSFWPTVNAVNERLQYHLDSEAARRLFYIHNWPVQMGRLAIAVTAIGLVGIVRLLATRRPPMDPIRRAAVAWALVFALAPYLILMPRGDYSPTADINMVPFQLIVGMTGVWALVASSAWRMAVARTLLVAALLIDAARVIEHGSERVYAGVDPVRAVHELGDLLERHRYREWRLYELYEDIYFNAATVVNVIYRDPILRSRFDVSVARLRLDLKVSPAVCARDRYWGLAEGANILLVTDQPKGPLWRTVNRQWAELRRLVAADERFSLLGVLHPYDDGTGVEVWGRQFASLQTDSDGWLLRGGTLTVSARTGPRPLLIRGIPAGESVRDLWLVSPEGRRVKGRFSAEGPEWDFLFPLAVTETTTILRVEGDAVIPAELGVSADRRALLLLHPRALFLGRATAGEPNPR